MRYCELGVSSNRLGFGARQLGARLLARLLISRLVAQWPRRLDALHGSARWLSARWWLRGIARRHRCCEVVARAGCHFWVCHGRGHAGSARAGGFGARCLFAVAVLRLLVAIV